MRCHHEDLHRRRAFAGQDAVPSVCPLRRKLRRTKTHDGLHGRIRQEELIYVLQRLVALRLAPNTLWASMQSSPSTAIASPAPLSSGSPSAIVRDAMLRSPLAHLYELHRLLTNLLEVARNEPSIVQAYMPQRFAVGLRDGDDQAEWDGLPPGCKIGVVGRRHRDGAGRGEKEMDVGKLALRCLKLVGEEIGAGSSFA